MSNQITTFTYNSNQIRTNLVDNNMWFCANDLCANLGYAIPHKAIRDHVDGEDVLKWITPTKSGNQNMLWVNESGMYALIFGSKLDTAKDFKRWVTSEVLPQIRKTGAYQPTKQSCMRLSINVQEIESFFRSLKLADKSDTLVNVVAKYSIERRDVIDLMRLCNKLYIHGRTVEKEDPTLVSVSDDAIYSIRQLVDMCDDNNEALNRVDALLRTFNCNIIDALRYHINHNIRPIADAYPDRKISKIYRRF